MILDLNKTYIKVLKKQNILILGATLRSGVSIANTLYDINRTFNVNIKYALSDSKTEEQLKDSIEALKDKDIKLFFGNQDISILDNITLIIISPGIPHTIPIVEEAKRRNIKMSTIPFRPLALGDSEAVMRQVWQADCRNCDYNFMNLMSWRFLFGTELAFHENWLLIRFRSGARLAYLPPVGSGDWADILPVMRDDAHSLGEQFRLMGVCPHSLERLEHTMPCEYVASTDRNAADYLYIAIPANLFAALRVLTM